MAEIRPSNRGAFFSRVKEAREALKEQAEKILEEYMLNIKMAQAKGDFETAAKQLQWLMEHMPEEDGVRVVDISIDKPIPVEGKSGPTIQIGFALGGIPQSGQIPAPIIEVKPEEDDE